MKYAFASILAIVYTFVHAQTMTTEEKELRQNANFNSFLSDVKTNSPTGCLCKQNEYVVFSFDTKNNKTASLCVSKKLNANNGYLIYRFGTKNRTELTFPTDTINSLSRFSIAHYHRGGGTQNAAMYINSFRFTNGDYTYTLYDNWNSEDDRYSRGIDVANNKTGKSISLPAKGRITGSLYAVAMTDMVAKSDEL